MKLLLDECVTRLLKRDLTGHDVHTVVEAGFKGLKNGALLRAAAGTYDALITVDKNLKYQQNIRNLQIAVIVLVARSTTYGDLKPLLPRTLEAAGKIKPGEIVTIQ
jgi:hypothetical protein